MLRRILPFMCMFPLVPVASWAGENPDAKMAMHIIASEDSLGWNDLAPAACESINVDVSVSELFAEGGYGYVVLLAYDVEGISGVEFALDGWPTGRGAPQLSGPYWHAEGATTFGDHLDEGGATGLGECVEPDTTGLAVLAYLTFGPLDSTDVPIDLSFLPSTYTAPEDSLVGVTDCTEIYQIDEVVLTSGSTIGGTHESQPECAEDLGGAGAEDSGSEEEGGDLEPDGDGLEWPVVVEVGVLYAYGNRLESPYVFTLESNTLYVNGVQLSPPLRRNPLPEVTVTEWHRAVSALSKQTMDMAFSLLESGVPMEAIIAQVSDVYCQSVLVDTVTAARGASIWIHWKDREEPTMFSFPTSVSPTAPVRDQRSIAIGTAKAVQSLLRNSAAVFVGKGYRLTVPNRASQSLLEEMNLLHETQDAEADGLRLIKRCVAEDLLDPLPIVENH